MLVATGNYTKLIPYFEKDTKAYEFDIMLDGVTDSFDLAEEIQFISDDQKLELKNNLDQQKIQEIIDQNFTGKITQVPPKYSALKIDGKRAYDLARS
jgi:tRNA pseudouridine55 synthase